MIRSRRFILLVVILVLLLSWGISASAATTEIRALLDLDDDVATGCSVMTVDGAFTGVEIIHTTTVETTGGLPTVTGVSTRTCTDPGTDTFGPPVAIASPYAPPWAVGIGNGVGGTDVVESYLPLTGVVSGGLIHVGFETGSATTGDLDALLTSGGSPMLIVVGAAAGAANIPTVGEWGLIILGLLLVVTALVVMRRHPETRALMMVVLMLGGATVAYAAGFVPDGMTGDWTGEPQLGSDATGDAVAGDLAAVFAGVESNIVFLRYDMVNFANTAPTADDQTVGTSSDTPVAITLTGSDPEGDALSYTIETNPANGTLSGTAPNLTYTPDPGYFGPDAFTFTVDDGELASSVATVTINVVNDNTAPVVADQGFSVAENSPNATVVGTVAASDADGDTLTYAITAGNVSGAFALDPSTGQLTVADTSQLDYETTTQFILTVQVTDDGNGNLTDTATITIDVTDVNEAPVALGDGYATPEDTPLVVAAPGVLGNDTDPDGDALTAVLDTNVANGTLVLNGDGSFTYTPSLNFNGSDSFTYHANDGGLDSNVVTVTIAVSTINDTPMAVDDVYATDEDTLLNVAAPGVMTNDVDAEGDPLTVTAFDGTSAQGATVNVNADGSFSYDPTGAAALQALDDTESVGDTFTYTISDGVNPATATVTVTVSGLNDAPVATDDAYTTAEDTALNVTAPGVLGNDTDVDVEPLTVVLDTTVTNGTLALNAGGSFTYTPNPNYNGSDSFTYRANDGTANSNVATVTITVTADPDPPVAVDDAYATDEDTVLNVPASGVLANDTDPESDPLAVTAFDAVSAQGATVGVNADGSFSYDPTGASALQALDNAESVGDTFTYTIGDGNGGFDTATVTVTVSGVNDAPVATDDAYVTDEDTPLSVVVPGVLVNDTDVDGEPLTVVLDTTVTNGTLALNAGGSFTYTPNPNYNGSDSFTYRANDGTANSNVATVTITVNSVNDAPIAAADTYSGAGNVAAGNTQFAAGGATPTAVASVSSAQSIAANDADPDAGDTLTYSVASSNTTNGGTVMMNADGSFLYTPPSNPAIASDTFTYTVTDTGLLTDTAVVTITIEDFVWYVDNSNTTAPFNGTSTDPFQTLTAAESASAANQTIYVFRGDSGTTAYSAGITLKNGQRLYGEGVDLVVTLASSPVTLVTGNPAGKPIVRTTTASVSVDSTGGAMENIEIRGLDLGNIGTDDTVSIIEGGNTLSVALSVLDLNTNTTGAGQRALFLDGSGAANLVVTEMQNIVVTQSGAAVQGIVSLQAIFDADPSDADFTGDTVSGGAISVGSAGARLGGAGVFLQNSTGSLSMVDLDVFTTGSDAVTITGTGQFNAGAGTGFGLTINGGTVDATTGRGVDMFGLTTNTVTLDTVNASGATYGIRLQQIGGTMTVSGGAISATTNIGVFLQSVTATFSYGGTISATIPTLNNSVVVRNSTGTMTFSGAINDDAGGISLENNAGGTISFSGGLDIDTISTGVGFSAIGGGTVNVTGTNDINTSAGTGIGMVLNGITIGGSGMTFSGVTTSGAATGILLSNVSGGALTVAGGAIQNVSSGGVSITGGTGNVSIGATISTTAAGRSVLVTNHTAGTIIFSGAIDDNGLGVRLDSNAGATITFSGGLDIASTSNTGFHAVSSGTVQATQNNATIRNVVSTTTGIAVNIQNTTIGASGVTFRSVSSNGAVTGVVLNNTGASGSFTVTGDGGSIQNGSGGLLTNITADAVTLTDVAGVFLDQLNMSNVGNNGIAGIRVNGLSVTNATFTNVGNADPEDVFSFDRDTMGDNGLIGTALFQNLTITNFAERAIDIVNEGGGSLDLDVLNVSANDNNDTFGEDAIRVQNEGSVNANVLVSGGTYNNVELDVLAYFAQGTGSNVVQVTGVTSTNGGGPDNNPNGGGIAVTGSAGSTTSFDINANTLTGVQGAVIQIVGLPAAGQTVTLNGTIGGGNILTSDNADGIDMDFDGHPGGGSAVGGTIVVTGNTINFDDDGIGVDHRDAGGTMNVTISNNALNAVVGDDGFLDAGDGIFIFTDDDIGAAVNQVNLEILDNTVTNLLAGSHVIVVVDVQDGNRVCLTATGNSNGGGNGNIELDTAAAADLVVKATSAANLSALNNGIGVTEVAAPTYNASVDCIP